MRDDEIATLEDLKNAAQQSGAETTEELIRWANGLHIEGWIHDAFVYGVGAASEVLNEADSDD